MLHIVLLNARIFSRALHAMIEHMLCLSLSYYSGEEIEGVEPAGTIKAMEKMLKEGVVGEAEPLFHDEHLGGETKEPQTKDPGSGDSDFNDVNYWRSDYSPSAVDEQL